MTTHGKTHFRYLTYLASAVGMLLGMSACEQPTTFVPGHTDRFVAHSEDAYAQAQQVLQADYLFVLDYSYSMSKNDAKLVELTNAMGLFTQSLSSENINYNIGFINGLIQAGDKNLAGLPTIATNFVAPFITVSSGADASILSQIAPAGTPNNPNTNYMLEAALRTMKAQSTNFLRSGSQLVYVFVSDADDESDTNSKITGAKTVDYYADQLRQFKSDDSYISARSFTAGVAAGCTLESGYDSAGTRLAAVAQIVDSAQFAPQCVYTPMASSLDGLARNVTKTTTRFALRGTPQPGTVRIYTGASLNSLNSVPAEQNWSYLSTSNEVVFQAGHEPHPGEAIRIEYQMLFGLQKTANPTSISVTINGSTIAQSASNGWTFVAAENRIEFHGSAIPAQDADVRISYTSQ